MKTVAKKTTDSRATPRLFALSIRMERRLRKDAYERAIITLTEHRRVNPITLEFAVSMDDLPDLMMRLSK